MTANLETIQATHFQSFKGETDNGVQNGISKTKWNHLSASIPPRYQILGQIGTGGMGVVYKARDRETGEVVALKMLRPEVASDPEMQQNLRKEVCLARKVTHKNVCRIHEFNRSNDTVCLSMEFVEGENLLSKLRRVGPLPLEESLNIGRQICAGLAEAHVRGIVHRDLKPANIMLDTSGDVKIMDFGIARVSQGNTQMTGTIAGTPAYMAPEQVQLKSTGPRADIYSVGLLLYEMVTGVAAFEGETAIAIAVKQLHEYPKKPGEIVRTLPEDIESVILKCLRKDPAERFQSVEELRAALEEKPRAQLDSKRLLSVEINLPDLKLQQAVDYGMGKARAAVPILAAWATEIERETLKAAKFAGNATTEVWTFVRAWNFRRITETRSSAVAFSGATVLGVVLLGTAFAYGSHPQRRNYVEAGPPASVKRTTQDLPSSDLKAVTTQDSPSAPISTFILPAAPPFDDDGTVKTSEVDLNENSETGPAIKALGSDSGSADETPSSQAPTPPRAVASASRSKVRNPRSASVHTFQPTLVALSVPQTADDSANAMTAQNATPDLSTPLLPAATPEAEPKPAAAVDMQIAAASQPAVTENYLEVASFNDPTWADKAVDQLKQLGFHAIAVHKTRLWMQSYHVQVGPFPSVPDMEAAEKSLAKLNFKSRPAR